MIIFWFNYRKMQCDRLRNGKSLKGKLRNLGRRLWPLDGGYVWPKFRNFILIAIFAGNWVFLRIPDEGSWTVVTGQSLRQTIAEAQAVDTRHRSARNQSRAENCGSTVLSTSNGAGKREIFFSVFFNLTWVYQPLDILLCPFVGLGCRYLTLDRRSLSGRSDAAQRRLDAAAAPTANSAPIQEPRRVHFNYRKLRYAIFDESDLRNVDFGRSDLRCSAFRRASLQGVQFDFAFLNGVNFDEVDGPGTVFFHAYLREAHFDGARLEGADFSEAVLRGADFSQALLLGANFRDAELSGIFNQTDARGASFRQGHVIIRDALQGWVTVSLDESAPLRGYGIYPRSACPEASSQECVDDEVFVEAVRALLSPPFTRAFPDLSRGIARLLVARRTRFVEAGPHSGNGSGPDGGSRLIITPVWSRAVDRDLACHLTETMSAAGQSASARVAGLTERESATLVEICDALRPSSAP
jgi:uncharacterized protein YjbI with pentapeptide repeats